MTADGRTLFWSLYNNSTREQLDGVTFDQMRFVVALINPGSRYLWSVWHEGLPDWMELEKCDQLIRKSSHKPVRSPPLPPSGLKSVSQIIPGSESEMVVSVGEMTQVAAQPSVDQRLSRRFRKAFAIEIKIKGKLFRTQTKNVSLGGILLADSLPAELGSSFHVTMSRKNGQSVNLICTIVKSSKDAPANRLKIMEVDKGGLLRSWLIESAQE